MAVGREEVLTQIETHWTHLAEIIARIPAHRVEKVVVVGTWPVKDLLGHITTWGAGTMDNTEWFLDPQSGYMRSYPDTDGFKDQAAEAKTPLPVADVIEGLEETHARPREFLMSLREPAYHQSAVSWRIKLDSYDRYKEHPDTLRSRLGSADRVA